MPNEPLTQLVEKLEALEFQLSVSSHPHCRDGHRVALEALCLARSAQSEAWIRCDERMPETNIEVLILRKTGKVDSGRRSPSGWRLTGGGYVDAGWVTHWAPMLPAPPEQPDDR